MNPIFNDKNISPNSFSLDHFLNCIDMVEVDMLENGQSVDDEQVEECDALFDSSIHQRRKIDSWARLVAYIVVVLVGESSTALLGGLYFKGGGNNIFLVALLEFVAFPILIPIYIYFSSRSISTIYEETSNKTIMTAIYLLIGLFEVASSIMYAVGLQQLPVSTYSLISATQLGFNALFAFSLNSEKFTPSTLNAVVLLTASSTLLIFQPDHCRNDRAGKGRTAGKFVVGSACTLMGSALYALTLSLTQLILDKSIKKETFCSILHMNIFKSLVATCAILVPLSTGGGWRVAVGEMDTFKHGRGAYMVVVATTAVASQLRAIGSVGLILEVSSLFSNVIATVGLPVVPILGAIFFHESLDGIKVISIILAVWGFTSYVYQHYCQHNEIVSTQIRPCAQPAQESLQAAVPLGRCF